MDKYSFWVWDGGLVQFWWKKAQKYTFDSKHTTGAPNTFALVEKILLPAEKCNLFVNSCIILRPSRPVKSEVTLEYFFY